ncbi:MAG: response regulator [Candidatus Devosia symbiotica]|nr:response regulator [Candidatus Devosia symbiotica]
MVVDDNADYRDLMREILSPLGFAVLNVKDGSSCLETIDLHQPDLYFLDIRTPGMSGWTLLQALGDRGVVH